jgi:hypothetical protein
MALLSLFPNAFRAVLRANKVLTVVIAQKKHLHVSFVDQKEAPSKRKNDMN